MSKCPSFRYMGGKARLRKWLISHFPQEGNKYIEPFLGLGNVFYLSKQILKFKEWHLSDINIKFFNALRNANFDDLPNRVSAEEFVIFKEKSKIEMEYIAHLIEPKITFAGKGYTAGFDRGHPSHPPYNGVTHRILCENARFLIQDVLIIKREWFEIDYSLFDDNDFVYFDPPYYNTKASYSNIKHENLVEVINKLKCKWAISGYDSELYKILKYKNKYEKTRNSEIKSSNTGHFEAINEILWTNY